MTKYLLDDILEEAAKSSGQAALADVAAVPPFCAQWPQIRTFLEWAKMQTKNPLLLLAIDALIILGNRVCAGDKT
jgi:hypothetical protein